MLGWDLYVRLIIIIIINTIKKKKENWMWNMQNQGWHIYAEWDKEQKNQSKKSRRHCLANITSSKKSKYQQSLKN